MARGILGFLAVLAFSTGHAAGDEAAPGTKSGTNPEHQGVYQFLVKDIDGKEVSLSKYKGDVLLIVNVASK